MDEMGCTAEAITLYVNLRVAHLYEANGRPSRKKGM